MKNLLLRLLPILIVVGLLAVVGLYMDHYLHAPVAPPVAPIPAETSEPPPPAVAPEDEQVTLNTSDDKIDAMLSRLDPKALDFFLEVADAMESGDLKNPVEIASKVHAAVNDGSIKALDPEQLKQILPAAFPAMRTLSRKGRKGMAMFGMSSSSAEGSYKGENGQRLSLKIMDFGSMKGVTFMAGELAGAADLRKENGVGYIQTGIFQGHKSFEKFVRARKSTQLNIFVGERFMLEARGRKMSMDELKALIATVDFSALAALETVPLPAEAAPPTP